MMILASLMMIGAYTAQNHQPDDAYILSGRLTSSSVSRAIDNLWPGRLLIIRSAGGDVDPSLDLAEVIHQRNIRVNVTGHCLSGCAIAVLSAANRLTIAPDAIIGFHHSPIDIEMRYIASDLPVPYEIANGARRIRDLYRQTGADVAILTCAAEQTGATLGRRRAVNPATGREEMGWLDQRSWWVVRAEDLHRFGVLADFPPPTVPLEVWKAETRRTLQSRFEDDVRIGDAPEDCGRREIWAAGPSPGSG